jgi:fucose 4-O-acetylase-like acetyltransferase
MAERERIVYIDVAKGIGIFLILFVHSMENGFPRQVAAIVPIQLFFFLSGTTYRIGFGKGVYKDVWIKRFFRVYVPYLIVSLFSIAVYAVATKAFPEAGFPEMPIGDSLLAMLYGNARGQQMQYNQPLWYIPCMLVVFLLVDITEYILYRMQLRDIKHREILRWVFVALSFLGAFLFGVCFRSARLPFGLEAGLFVYPFMEMGIVVRRKEWDTKCAYWVKNHKPVSAIFFLLLMAATVGVCILNDEGGFVQVKSLQFGNSFFLYLLASVLMVAAILILAMLFGRARAIAYAGKNSLTIFLFHKFPILFFQVLVKPVGRLLKKGNTPEGCATGVGVALVTILACLALDQILTVTVPWVIGKTKRKKMKKKA